MGSVGVLCGGISPLALLAQCSCSLRHDTSKPCLSKYIIACLPSLSFKAHPSYAVFVAGGILLRFAWKVCQISPVTCL